MIDKFSNKWGCNSYMNKFFLFIVLCFLSSWVYASPDEVKLNNDIKNILEQYRLKYHLPAISLSIQLQDRDKISDYVSGYYSLANNKKITPDTLFQMGSITKTFTATIIYQLMENNKLKLSDTVSQWLPQYSRWNKITVKDLLHHTSGIYNYTQGRAFDRLIIKNPQKYWSLDELANMAYQHEDLFSPGIKYNYTNTDYILLGLIIEKITQQSIKEVFDNYFKKYHLNNTYYLTSDNIQNKIAQSYNRDGTFKFNENVTSVNISFTQSAGSVISTPHDIVKWLHLFFTNKIINKKSVKSMLKLISENDAKTINKIHIPNNIQSASFTEIGIGSGIGLIYFKNVGLTWVHSGGTAGFESMYAYNPGTGIYLAFAYNVKPKQQLIFMRLADDIFNLLITRGARHQFSQSS